MKKIKVGLASYGMSGRVFHGPLLNIHPGFEVIAVWERAKKASYGVFKGSKIVREFNSLLHDEEIELIIVNTPDSTHYEYTLQALNAGKHVVVEKPFVLESIHGKELIAIAEKQKLILTVFQNRRWDSDFLTIQEILQKKWLGRIVELESHFDRYRNFIKPNTWKESADSLTGIEYNLGSHLIDQALVLFGKPKAVVADIGIQRTGGKVNDYFEFDLFYEGWKVKLKSSYLVREPGPRFSIHGTEGSFLKWGLDPQEEMLASGVLPIGENWGKEPEKDWGLLNTTVQGLHFRGKIETIPGDYLSFYDNLYLAFTSNTSLAVLASESLAGIELIEAVKISVREGRKISL